MKLGRSSKSKEGKNKHEGPPLKPVVRCGSVGKVCTPPLPALPAKRSRRCEVYEVLGR